MFRLLKMSTLSCDAFYEVVYECDDFNDLILFYKKIAEEDTCYVVKHTDFDYLEFIIHDSFLKMI